MFVYIHSLTSSLMKHLDDSSVLVFSCQLSHPEGLSDKEKKGKKTRNKKLNNIIVHDLTLLHSEQPKLHRVLAILSAIVKKKAFLTSGYVHLYHLDQSISSFRGYWWMFSFLPYFP